MRNKLCNVHFYSFYAPPSLEIEELPEFIDRLVADARERSPVVIAGDFNAWATDWGSKWTNRRGTELLDAMICLDLVLLNTGDVPTYERDGRTLIVDLKIVSSSLARQNNKWTVNDVLNLSDHQVISWKVATGKSTKVRPRKKTNARGWKVRMFDPELFRTTLAIGPINANNATEEAELVMQSVVDSCDATMPRKSTCNRHSPVYWCNNNIAALQKECIKARRGKTRAREARRNYEELNEKHKRMQLELVKSNYYETTEEPGNAITNLPSSSEEDS